MNHEQLSIDDARAMLQFLDTPEDRDLWVSIGGAIKHEFGEAGFDIWDEWSATASNYQQKAARNTWKSIKPYGMRKTSTIGSLIKRAMDAGYKFNDEMSADDKAMRAEAAKQRAAARAIEEQKSAEEAERWQRLNCTLSAEIWQRCGPTGKSAYLGAKKVGGYGIAFVRQKFVVEVIEAEERYIIHEGDKLAQFWDSRTEETSFKYLKPGAIVVPLRNQKNEFCNVQIIFPSGKKHFLLNAQKAGAWHLIGDPVVGAPMAIAEGYATAASIHLATGWQVVVAFDSGNLPTVAEIVRDLYPGQRWVVCGDDDRFNDDGTERPDNKNSGKIKANQAAAILGGVALFPNFAAADVVAA